MSEPLDSRIHQFLGTSDRPRRVAEIAAHCRPTPYSTVTNALSGLRGLHLVSSPRRGYYVATSQYPFDVSTLDDRILSFLRSANRPVHLQVITSSHPDYSPRTIATRLYAMTQDGRIEHPHRGYYAPCAT